MGCGGKLVWVPWVRAFADGKAVQAKVFVHPYEGALLVMFEDGRPAVAFDREKNTTYLLNISHLVVLSASEIEIPADTPALLEGLPPVFGTSEAEAEIGGTVIVVRDAA